jgi:excinuclease ABC subunit B
LAEAQEVIAGGDRVLVTVLTKKMAEDLSQYMQEVGMKAKYLHSDIHTIERVEILRGLRRGDFDVLIGINLLREGLDLVEVALVAILDADKEGFLRSTRSLIQTVGRAARNIKGRAILYADRVTRSMQEAIDETTRRRVIQEAFNKEHGIIPRTASRSLDKSLTPDDGTPEVVEAGNQIIDIPADPNDKRVLIASLKKKMFDAASKREFEEAAQFRDAIRKLEEALLLGES